MSDQNKRRQFLKNTSLAALSLGMLSQSSKAKETPTPPQMNCNPTTEDFYGTGPFYTDNPPNLVDNQLANADEPGEKIIISGRVFNLDCAEYIPDTKVDIWHADDAGAYDNEGYNLRGVTYTNSQGFYVFETIKPGKYLNGNQYRPSHIHFKITPPGFEEMTTQLYFEGDTDIPADAAASITSGQYDASHRIIPLTANAQGIMEGTWDIVVNGSGLDVGTNTQDLHLNKGMIYSASPNPIAEDVIIKYGVFKKSKVSLSVFNMQGNLVANLAEQNLAPEKYEAVWQHDDRLPKGHYFITLKINDLQVHYVKVVKV